MLVAAGGGRISRTFKHSFCSRRRSAFSGRRAPCAICSRPRSGFFGPPGALCDARSVPLKLGSHVVDPPVVLAPMAGITNVAFRQLCREQGAGLYVCEMVTTRALVERNPRTMRMIAFGAGERPRSLQLYGVDPATVRKAVELVVAEDLADHIDLNFGCSVP